MKSEELVILMIKGAISQLPEDQAKACAELAQSFRDQVAAAGEEVGRLALGLVGAEYAAKE